MFCQRMWSVSVLVAAISLSLFVTSKSEGEVTFDLNFVSGATNLNDLDNSGMTSMMEEAARRLSLLIDDDQGDFEMQVFYSYHDGSNGNQTAYTIPFDETNDGSRVLKTDIFFFAGRDWYIDPTPTDDDEFEFTQQIVGDLTPAELAAGFDGPQIEPLLELGYRGVAKPGETDANGGFDMLSTAIHEIFHNLGIIGTFLTAADLETQGDLDYDLPPVLVGGKSMAVKVPAGSEFHVVPDGPLMSDVGVGQGVRRLPAATDLFAAAGVSKWEIDLQRQSFFSGTNWETPGNWEGASTPDPTDQVYFRHGGRVQLNGNETVAQLLVQGSSSIDTNNNRLIVTGDATIVSDDSSPFAQLAHITIEPGGELETDNLLIDGAKLDLRGGLADIDGQLTIESVGVGRNLTGFGTVDIQNAGGEPFALNNNGRIVADGGTLTLTSSNPAALFDLDGNTGTGLVEATLGSIVVDAALQQVTGEITIGSARFVQINDDWRLAGAGTIDINGGNNPATAAQLLGGDIEVDGDIDVSGHARIDARTVLDFGSLLLVRSNGSLVTDHLLIHNFGNLDVDAGGSVTMNSTYDAASGAAADIDGDVIFNGQARIAGTNFQGSGRHFHNGPSTIWQDADVTIGEVTVGTNGSLVVRDSGTELQSQQSTVFGTASISRSARWINTGEALVRSSTGGASVTVSDSSDWTIGGDLDVGNAGGTGSVTVESGTVDVGELLTIASGSALHISGGDVLATNFTRQSGGSFNLTNGSFTLSGGDGALNSSYAFGGTAGTDQPTFGVNDGGDMVVSSSWHIGSTAGTHATTNVSGRNSTLRGVGNGASADLYVGRFGTGTLLIEDGGYADFGDDFEIARDGTASVGTATIRGTSTPVGQSEVRSEVNITRGGSGASLNVGRLGTGTLNIEDGALVQVGGGISVGTNGTGELNIGGLSDRNTNAELLAPSSSILIGRTDSGDTTGDVNVTPGGGITANRVVVQPRGNLNINGGTVFVENFERQAGGDFQLVGGTLRITGGDGVFNSPFAFGGPAPTLLGASSVEILAGADVVVTSSWHSGAAAGGIGITHVAGTSADGSRRSTLRGTVGGNGADLYVGRFGEGALLVEDGGLIDLRDDFEIARDSIDSAGQAVVRGVANAGGQLIRSEIDVTGRGTNSALIVGQQGDGSLSIESGALVRVAGPVAIANTVGSTGQLDLVGFSEGFPAELYAPSSTVTVGNMGGGGNTAIVNVFNGGLLIADTLRPQSTGIANLSGGEIRVDLLNLSSAQAFNMSDGVLNATTVSGTLAPIGGVVSPENSQGRMILSGLYEPTGSAALELDLAGTTAASGYEQVVIDGFATLGGELWINLEEAFVPSLGDSFELLIANSITGTFDALLLPELSSGLGWDIIYAPNQVTLEVTSSFVAGDYNDDGVVDTADYTVWRDNLGLSILLPGDSTPGTVSQADYAVWKSNYGASVSTGAGSSSSTSVPEPCAVVVALIGALGIAGRRFGRSNVA